MPAPQLADRAAEELPGPVLQREEVLRGYRIEDPSQLPSVRPEQEELGPEALRLFAVFVVILTPGVSGAGGRRYGEEVRALTLRARRQRGTVRTGAIREE